MPDSQLYFLIVNQKLTFARLALEQAQRQAAEDVPGRLAQHAQLDAAILQLNQALLFFAREVAEQYQVPFDIADLSLASIIRGFAEQGLVSPEMREINSLLNTPDGWLAQLWEAGRDPQQLAQRYKAHAPEQTPVDPNSLINVVNLSDASQAQAAPLDWVADCSAKLQTLIERQRSMMVEN